MSQANGNADIVPIIERKIGRESHPAKIRALRRLLADRYRDKGNYPAARAVYLDDFKDNPSEPMPLIILAGQKLNEEDQPEEAMRIISQAVDIARRSGTFRRLALGVKARVGLLLHNYRVVEGVLKEIMDLKFTRGNVDIGVERDFFDRLPAGRIDPEIAERYDEFCRAHGKPQQPD